MNTPWVSDLLFSTDPKLTVEEFTAKYFPQYVKEWQPDYRIKLRPDGRCTRMPSKADYKTQTTKRANRVNAAYEHYSATFEAAKPKKQS